MPTYFLTKAADADPGRRGHPVQPRATPTCSSANHQGAIYWLREALRRDPADADAHSCSARRSQRIRQHRRGGARDGAGAAAVVAVRRTREARGGREARRSRAASSACARTPTSRAGAAARAGDRQHRAARAARARGVPPRSRPAAVRARSRIARRWPSCAAPSTCRRTKRRRTC